MRHPVASTRVAHITKLCDQQPTYFHTDCYFPFYFYFSWSDVTRLFSYSIPEFMALLICKMVYIYETPQTHLQQPHMRTV